MSIWVECWDRAGHGDVVVGTLMLWSGEWQRRSRSESGDCVAGTQSRVSGWDDISDLHGNWPRWTSVVLYIQRRGRATNRSVMHVISVLHTAYMYRPMINRCSSQCGQSNTTAPPRLVQKRVLGGILEKSWTCYSHVYHTCAKLLPEAFTSICTIPFLAGIWEKIHDFQDL